MAAEAEAATDSEGDGLLSLQDSMMVVGAGEDEKHSDLKAALELYMPEEARALL